MSTDWGAGIGFALPAFLKNTDLSDRFYRPTELPRRLTHFAT
jgi:hypothetical protein